MFARRCALLGKSGLISVCYPTYQPLATMCTISTNEINPNVIAMEYAVRGPIVARAGAIEEELKAGVSKPFKDVIRCNIGDCHAVGQSSITFLRQVLAGCAYPALLSSNVFPEDVVTRCKELLASCRGASVGSYTDSVGLSQVRKDVAGFISNRDGIDCDVDSVFCSTGASDAIKAVLRLVMTGTHTKPGEEAGIFIPIPQYPLYTATLSEFGAHPIGYYLDESNNWALSVDELERAMKEAKGKCKPRAIVVINPGNPTGQVLTEENVQQVIKFAEKNRLMILADEVYQFNVYAKGSRFVSFRSQLKKLNVGIELASFNSVSKGYMGECGLRGGYCQIENFAADVKAQLYKSISASLCSSSLGQIAVSLSVRPPPKDGPSFKQFESERDKVLSELKTKAQLVSTTYNSMEGISCNEVQGAMYAFPQIHLPKKAIAAAEADGKKPDAFYCFALLEETGICVVPGSGFEQVPGTFHFRTTILPPVDKLKESMERFRSFHEAFMKKYA